jgi:hypothetical protein
VGNFLRSVVCFFDKCFVFSFLKLYLSANYLVENAYLPNGMRCFGFFFFFCSGRVMRY